MILVLLILVIQVCAVCVWRLLTRRVGRYLELYDTWAPEELDIPHAVVLVLAAGSFSRPEVVAGPLDELRRARPCS